MICVSNLLPGPFHVLWRHLGSSFDAFEVPFGVGKGAGHRLDVFLTHGAAAAPFLVMFGKIEVAVSPWDDNTFAVGFALVVSTGA